MKNKQNFDVLFQSLSKNYGFNFDLISFTETWLDDSLEQLVDFPGYSKVMKHKHGKKEGGGLAVFVKENFKFHVRNDIFVPLEHIDCFDCLFIELQLKPKNIIIGLLYRSPSHNTVSTFNEFILNVTEKISREGRKLVLMGDFNINLLRSNNENEIGLFLDSMIANNLMPKITLPTRVTENTATLIDHIYSNIEKQDCLAGTLTTDISDHYSNFFFMKSAKIKSSPDKYVTFRPINDLSLSHFNEVLQNENWQSVLSENDPNTAYRKFLTIYTDHMNNTMPLKTCRFNKYKHKAHPWITKGLLKSLYTKDKLYSKYIKCRNPDLRQERENDFKNYRNLHNKLIRIAKSMYWHNTFDLARNDIKLTWKNINTILGRNNKKTHFPEVFKYNNSDFKSPHEIADGFNSFFTNIGPNLASKISNPITNNRYTLTTNLPHSFYLNPTCSPEVISVINKLKPKTSSGSDGISPKLIKGNSMTISEPLAHIINLSFKEGIFPQDLKVTKVIPIFKSKDHSNFENYHPISLLPTFSKIFERLVYNRLFKYINANQILTTAQYGFQRKLSTEQAIIELQNRVIENLSSKKFCLGIFIDLSKAFDTLNHRILLDKLFSYGIRGISHKWFTSYLHNRTQYTEYLSCKSSMGNVCCGVPQGSILGPLLFLLYMNDVVSVCQKCSPILFADDTTLLYSNANQETLSEIVNNELKSISDWFACNRLSLNIEKTQYVYFRKTHSNLHSDGTNDNLPILKVNNEVISRVEVVKFLGVYIDEYLKWDKHIMKKANQVSKAVGTISRLKSILPKTVLLTLYNSLILPHMTYSIVAWGNSSKSAMKRLQILQKRTICIVMGAKYNSHTSPIFKSLNLLCLQDIFELENCKLYMKYCSNDLPQYLKEKLLITPTQHYYDMRNSNNNLISPRIHSKLEEQLISHKVAKVWNSQPDSIKLLRNTSKSLKHFITTFKNYKLNSYESLCHTHNCYICNRNL
jgi:hypothetical protein